MADRPVLIAYDGSPGSAAAIEAAGRLLGPGPATVATIWSPILVAAPAVGGTPAYLADLEPRFAQAAQATADEGARLARDAGFDAEGSASSEAPPWLGIVELAESLDAAVIVVGARGLSGFKSALLGSTSSGIVHHTKRPVLVVPQAEEKGS
jgi:nucleotide-binding universal stress UspA family protein